MLTNNEKLIILQNLISSIENTQYMITQELNLELAVESPNSNIVDGYNQQLLDLSNKLNYLNGEVVKLNNE